MPRIEENQCGSGASPRCLIANVGLIDFFQLNYMSLTILEVLLIRAGLNSRMKERGEILQMPT